MSGLLEKIYNASNKGLDIILYYYPQAQGCDKKGKFFKVRKSERTASASMKLLNNVWRVTDFGGDGTAMSPIDIAMNEEGCNYKEALYKLAERYGVSDTLKPTINKPTMTVRPASPDEEEGAFSFKLKDEPTESELEVMGPKVTKEVMKKYHYYSVISYSITKNRKTTVIASNDNYPIFLRECIYKENNQKKTFYKIYQPLNPNKAFRFFYHGEKPKDYINGLNELLEAYQELIDSNGSDETGEKTVESKEKLPEAVFCSGERDSLNCASFGYLPLWMNSETARLSKKDWQTISSKVERVYNIPDIDDTGIRKAKEFAMEYIDIYTVELPATLRNYMDNRGKPRKDLRDYVELHPSIAEFKDLLRMAKPCKFWEEVRTDKGIRYEINTVFMLHFLNYNGFYNLKGVNGEDTVVQIKDYIVREIPDKENNNFVRRFIQDYMETTKVDYGIINMFLNSRRAVGFVDSLKEVSLDFTNCTKTSQMLFFKNVAINVSKDNIQEIHNTDISKYVWEKNLCKHNFRRIEPAFTAVYDKNTGDITNFSIKHTKSKYFRFIINSSRIYWKEEYELGATGDPQADEKYIQDNKFNICGPRLDNEQVNEQLHNLINKFFTIGYLMHRYKLTYRAWAVWIMENKITEEAESSGGSGKSFMVDYLANILNVVTLPGRDKKLTDNPHVLDRVNEHTDLVKIDDAHQYFDFDFFYSAITGSTVVNVKQKTSKQLDFSVSPKYLITSNFPPKNQDGSTLRRILFCVMSDYYHKSTQSGEYKEERRIFDDFQEELGTVDYPEESWNEDFNFIIDCLQFYLTTVESGGIIQPPMANISKRINLAIMGQQFEEWASVYFSKESGRLDCYVSKKEAFEDFIHQYSGPRWSTSKFKSALIAFCKSSDYIEEFNPPELLGSDGKRILSKVNGETVEMIYLKSNFKKK